MRSCWHETARCEVIKTLAGSDPRVKPQIDLSYIAHRTDFTALLFSAQRKINRHREYGSGCTSSRSNSLINLSEYSSLKTNLSQIPEIPSLIHTFSNHFSFLYTFGSSGCYLSRILYILGHCWTYFTWKSSSRCNLTGRFPSSLSLQWSVYIFMCVWFSEFHFLFFENLVFNFVVYVCALKGLLSLLLLVALLGMAAKMDYISPTVCVHCFQLFLLFLFSL